MIIIKGEIEGDDMDEGCRRSIEESKTLAGMFQSIVQDCKVGKYSGLVSISVSHEIIKTLADRKA